jgi:rRNA maturation endonuclease Nob1
MKQCSKCQRTLPDDLNFCVYCGEKTEEIREQTPPECAHCGKENPTEVKFCVYCGKKMGESTATESHKRNDSVFCRKIHSDTRGLFPGISFGDSCA